MAKIVSTSIEWHNLDQVLAGYDTHTRDRENVYYAVFNAREPKFSYTGGDAIQGRELLQESLQPLVTNGSTAVYSIRFYPQLDKNGDLTNATNFDASGNFKLNEYQQIGYARKEPVEQSPAFEKLIQLMTMQQQQINELKEQLIEPESTDEELEEEIEEVEDASADEDFAWMAGVQKFEQAINNSPILSEAFAYGRLFVKALAKKVGIEDPLLNNQYQYQANTVAGTTNTESMEQQQQAPPVDKRIMMQELVAGFPELPKMLETLHHIMTTDPDLFVVAKNELRKGIKKLTDD